MIGSSWDIVKRIFFSSLVRFENEDSINIAWQYEIIELRFAPTWLALINSSIVDSLVSSDTDLLLLELYGWNSE